MSTDTSKLNLKGHKWASDSTIVSASGGSGSCAVNVVVCVKGDTALLSVKSLALGVFLVLREKALEVCVVRG